MTEGETRSKSAVDGSAHGAACAAAAGARSTTTASASQAGMGGIISPAAGHSFSDLLSRAARAGGVARRERHEARGYNRCVIRVSSILVMVALVLTPVGSLPAARAQSGGDARVLAATLDNGLRVLLLEDHRSPIVSFQVWYRVGSRNEQRGHTGLAHFLEHMMFKGTPTTGPPRLRRVVQQDRRQDNALHSAGVTADHLKN